MVRPSTTFVCFIILSLAGIGRAAPATTQADGPQSPLEQGKALAQQHEYAAAIEKYDQAIAASPDDAAAHAYKAASCLAASRIDVADLEIQKAMAIDGKNADYLEIAGQVQMSRGNVDQARALYEKAAQLSPKQAGAIYTDLAAALSARNDDHLAGAIETALKSAADADPPSAEALFSLGQSYAQAGKAEGKKYLQRYVELANALPQEQRDAQKIRIAKQLIRALDILQQQ